MKKSILPIIFVLIAIFSTFSQDYIPFPDSSVRWSIDYEGASENTGWVEYHYGGFYFEYGGDTIVGDKEYKKLYKKETWHIHEDYRYGHLINRTESNCTDCAKTIFGGIRQDTANQKVFFINFREDLGYPYDYISLEFDLNEEVLLYDFDVEVGDTIDYNYYSDHPYCELFRVVEHVDSVVLNDGIQRKRIRLFDHNCAGGGSVTNDWIEGIGDINSGLFGPYYFLFEGDFYTLACFKKNDEYLITKEYGFCDSIVVSIDESPDILPDEIIVFPNPAGSVINISHTSGTIKDLKVFNVLGKEIYAAKPREKTVPLDVTGWESGIYFVVVNGRYSARFIKP